MKRTIIFPLLFLAYFAQAQDLDTKSLSFGRNQLPTQPLPAEYTTYSAAVSKPHGFFTEEQLVNDYLGLHHFKRVEKGGHFFVNVVMERFNSRSELKTSSSKVKDKAGKETTVTKHYYEYTYFLPAYVKVTDLNGKVLLSEYVSNDASAKTVQSDERGTEASLKEYWKSAGEDMHRETLKESTVAAMTAARRLLQERFDIVPVKETVDFEVLDARKNEDTEAFQQQFEALKTALTGIVAEQPLDQPKALAAAPLEYFEKLAAKYNDPGEKSHRKIRAACLLTLATAHYCIEDFDKAIQLAGEVKPTGFFERRSELLAKQAATAKKSLATNQCSTRHFQSQAPADATAPDIAYLKVDAVNAAPANAERPNVAVFPAYFIGEKGRFTGEVEITGDGNLLDFRNNGNIKFFRTDTGKRHQAYLNPDWISELGFDGRVFEPGHDIFMTSLGGKTFKERLFQSKSVTVYRFYEYETVKPTVETTVALQKEGEKNPVNTAGVRFVNFHKALSNYFEDCPELSQRAANKEFERTGTSLVAAARAYAECKGEWLASEVPPPAAMPPGEASASSGNEAVMVVTGQPNEKMPEFPGGEQKLWQFLAANVKYPEEAVKNKIQGKVILSFVVEKDGSLSELKLVRDIGGGCGEEALRVAALIPKWNPGEDNGKPVRVQYSMPVWFRLD